VTGRTNEEAIELAVLPNEEARSPSPTIMIMALGRTLRAQADSALRTDGLSLRHLSALGHLSRHPGLSYSELARRAGISVQSMQATIVQLERRGAVERIGEPGRGRTATLRVTDVGVTLLQKGRAVIAATDQLLTRAVGNDHADVLNEMLLRAAAAAGMGSGQADS
jgi:DNA-binding MarR family transcriptional regulator